MPAATGLPGSFFEFTSSSSSSSSSSVSSSNATDLYSQALQLIKPALLFVAVPLAIVGLIAAYFVLYGFYRYLALHVLGTDPYAHIPRPKHKGRWWTVPIIGDFAKIRELPPGDAHRQFIQETNSNVLIYRMFFYAPRLLLVDPGALLHVLSAQNSYSFPKPAQARMFLERILGRGVLVVEGDVHKRQRKILQPAFNVSAVRDLTPIFFKHSKKLAARVGELVDECQGPSDTPFVQGQTVKSAQASQKGKLVVDLAYWLSRATLDIIGDAGFDWQFNSIDQKPEESGDELAGAFKRMLGVSPTLTQFLATYVKSRPGLTWLGKIWQTSRDKEIGECFQVLEKVSKNIIHNKRQAILQDMQAAGAGQEKKAGGLSKADWEVSGQGAAGDKDLLFLMMRSNMSSDIRDSERLSDAELLGQMTTLMLAGHETTATLLSWTFYQLAADAAVQSKLRSELQEYFAGRDELDFDELSSLPYLDAVIKETLRFNSPVPSTVRVCDEDHVIPLSKAYPTQNGKSSFNSIVIKKGAELFIPIYVVNTSEDIWGPTALKYDPERWFDVPKSAKDSGLPLHIMSFISGPRGCIGSRFSIAEAKAILALMILNFEFERVPGWQVEAKQGVVMRARIVGQEESGMQMPLIISRI